jgi:hypothetical protein
MKDLTGQRFGKLVALKKLPPVKAGTNWCWECRCDCGNTVIVRRGNLTSGNTTSCGCARGRKPSAKDISGQRFGRLVALRPTGQKMGSNMIWVCQCDCGEQTEANTSNLRQGHVRSCGCLAQENLQRLIEQGANNLRENEWKDATSLCSLTANTPNTNTSGRKGVHFDKSRNKWVAFITLRKKRKHLGYYSKFEDAVKAREEAEEELFEPVLNKYGRTLYDNEIPNERMI